MGKFVSSAVYGGPWLLSYICMEEPGSLSVYGGARMYRGAWKLSYGFMVQLSFVWSSLEAQIFFGEIWQLLSAWRSLESKQCMKENGS